MQKSTSCDNVQNEEEREPILIEDIIFNNKAGSLKSYWYLYHSDGSTEIMVEKKYTMEYPQLDTVLIVEYYMEKFSGKYNKKALWRALPMSMTYDTYLVIFDYLSESGKLSLDTGGNIWWTWNQEPFKKIE